MSAESGSVDAAPSRREITRQTKPILCYSVESIPHERKGGDELYKSLRSAVSDGRATLVQSLEIPACDAKSWKVADMNCWSMNNPSERFYSSKTRQIHATHLSRGDRLWSNMPFLRPLATIVEDTIDYGFDDDGAGVHDVIGSRCDPYTNHLMTGKDFNYCCHSNLTRAALDAGLSEMDVHDVLNVFMCTGFTRDTNQYFTKPSPVEVGDYIEFLAETDLLVSASCCPQGDVSMACGGGGEPVCYPLGVEVYKLEDGLLQEKGWSPSGVNGYKGKHGLPSYSLACTTASG
ncbi:hypothetical protein THAOC_34751 [Thalassiosira oceanica]|uniref:DUF1989 domain-containing protein n=1 Tax=Thalassiosira oceanica TaxID=159749 RepID=K0R2Y7_THAOC|nr:hypothetical protein THAOC_34751 [Thalassiosira oceanica]|eukprot:EJK46575.1 hypothetical protein THAOC_34751 [Thalassiosira oceanica]